MAVPVSEAPRVVDPLLPRQGGSDPAAGDGGNSTRDARGSEVAQQFAENDRRHHTANIKRMLAEAMQHTREDVGKVQEPKAQALFETTAEVLNGLITAYTHYEQESEPAWRR
jgi:hypothetical protein